MLRWSRIFRLFTELAFKEDGEKVRLALSKRSLDESQQDQALMAISCAVRYPPTPFT